MTVFLRSLFRRFPSASQAARSPLAQAGFSRCRAGVFFLAGLFMWAALLEFPSHVAGPQLDPSWAQSLAHFCKHRFQAGQEYIFTYGPLGYFITPNYDADLFWFKIAWEFVLKLALAVGMLRVTRHTLPFLPRLALCLLVALALSHNPDGSYVFFLFVLAVGLTRTAALSWKWLVTGTLLLATIALVKFTLLVQSVVLVALVSGRLLFHKPRSRALLPPALFAASLLAWWLALGQSLAHLPHYLYNSYVVASGYNDAMMFPGNPTNIYLALAVLAMLATALLSRSFFAPGGAGSALTAAVLLLFLFVQWKHGFVRQGLHQAFFFSTTLLSPFLFPALLPQYRWGYAPRLVLVACGVLLSAVGFVHVYTEAFSMTPATFVWSHATCAIHQARQARHLGDLKDRLDRQKEQMTATYHLPRIVARVRGDSVDAFNYEQGVVLLNPLHWTPRPVFQSYGAYTPYLQALNGRFLASDSAPKYPIFQLLGFDGRFPASEDGPALFEILRRYHPVLAEGANLLLERNRAGGEGPPAVWQPFRQRVVRLGEKVKVDDLPDPFHMVQIHLTYSWKGLVRSTLYRPPFLYLNVWLADQRMLTYRLVPAIARSGFLLNPFLQATGDVVGLYRKAEGKRVVAFCLTAEENGHKSFTSPICITLLTTGRLVGEELADKDAAQFRSPGVR